MNTQELRNMYHDTDVLNTCEVAVYAIANSILKELSTVEYHAERWAWAKFALDNPRLEAKKLLALVLIENAAISVEQVQNVQYTAFVNNINDVIDGYVTDKVV